MFYFLYLVLSSNFRASAVPENDRGFQKFGVLNINLTYLHRQHNGTELFLEILMVAQSI
jgi:hypothetical protein